MWWLSFVGDNGFLGVAIVREPDDIVAAARRAWALGLNPGGEVCGALLDDEAVSKIPIGDIERLLTESEARALAKILRGIDHVREDN